MASVGRNSLLNEAEPIAKDGDQVVTVVSPAAPPTVSQGTHSVPGDASPIRPASVNAGYPATAAASR